MLATNRKSSPYPGYFFLLLFVIVVKFVHLFTLSAQLMYDGSWIPYAERLPAALSTSLMNFDSMAWHIVLYLIAGPLLLSLSFFPEVTEPNYREYRQSEISRMGLWPSVRRRVSLVFVQVFLTVFLLHCVDYWLSRIIAPQQSLGFFRWAGNHFISNPLRIHQYNWSHLPYSIDAFYFFFSLQSALTQAMMLSTVILLSYWKRIDYRLLLFMPFLLLMGLDAVVMLLSIITGLVPLREFAPSALVSFFAGSNRRSLPFEWPMIFYGLAFVVFYFYSKIQLPKKGYLP